MYKQQKYSFIKKKNQIQICIAACKPDWRVRLNKIPYITTVPQAWLYNIS